MKALDSSRAFAVGFCFLCSQYLPYAITCDNNRFQFF
jgi:hypothetical protein